MNEARSTGGLADQPFSYRSSKDGRVFIYWRGQRATVLKGERARKLLNRLSDSDAEETQLQLARITGNFKRGNER